MAICERLSKKQKEKSLWEICNNNPRKDNGNQNPQDIPNPFWQSVFYSHANQNQKPQQGKKKNCTCARHSS